ncbi:hypothetical protein SmJEL517_g05079 [Synchytrium microbalum]|uniref:Uncharacterized protein n=1 Tax=Synchytrium microbalum TaxID=1806994 RepID=A0A507C0R6_9FUNG|nr:uncharacterized protein SmJEL517_g05079 [Synchytrium microbalum]TPX31654.1 hypothetical protein SmJEL517_g05079 [Synchytrium microbalum]
MYAVQIGKLDEATLALKQRESTKRELVNLIDNRIPVVLEEIGRLLREALIILSGSADVGSSPKSTSAATLVITSPNNDAVKGFLTVNGTSIVKGDLTIKFNHYNRGSPYKVTVNNSKPHSLLQLHLARNGVVAATGIVEDSFFAGFDRISLMQMFKRISNQIGQSIQILKAAPEDTLFPARDCDAKMFAPDLPEDLIVEFHVAETSVVCSIFAIQFHRDALPIQIQQLQHKFLTRFRGSLKTSMYKGRHVEILDELAVESVSPQLTRLEAILARIQTICQSTHHKLACVSEI